MIPKWYWYDTLMIPLWYSGACVWKMDKSLCVCCKPVWAACAVSLPFCVSPSRNFWLELLSCSDQKSVLRCWWWKVTDHFTWAEKFTCNFESHRLHILFASRRSADIPLLTCLQTRFMNRSLENGSRSRAPCAELCRVDRHAGLRDGPPGLGKPTSNLQTSTTLCRQSCNVVLHKTSQETHYNILTIRRSFRFQWSTSGLGALQQSQYQQGLLC
jgi:hypothetical protein